MKNDSASRALVVELRRELSVLKTDYNGMVDRYNTGVRAYKVRGEKIAALESLSGNRTAKAQGDSGSQQDTSAAFEGSIADQIRKIKSETADLANHPKTLATRRLCSELAAQNEHFKGRWNYQEPSQSCKYGNAHYRYDYGDTLNIWISES
ncbi:hypothetical protein DMW54_24800, partial [Serratia marcescens]